MFQLSDCRRYPQRPNEAWAAYAVSAADLEQEIAKLHEGTQGADGRREGAVVHPQSREPGLGLAPAISAHFGVLRPGEQTLLRRRNASSFSIGLKGKAEAILGGRSFQIGVWDSWITPGMQAECIRNNGPEPFHYLTYSNAPLLQKLEVYVEEVIQDGGFVADRQTKAHAFADAARRAKDVAGGPIPVGDSGAMLLPYEHLIDPDFVDSQPLCWPWEDIAPHLGLVRGLGPGYTGRPLWCLYNPATEKRNGTTFSFFATVTSAAPNFVGPAHRHVSAAINFILRGNGWSVVDGKRIDWAAGDIMLSAPGWAPHGHATGAEGAIILTIQDHPLHIGTESLIWQEDLKDGPVLTLGAQSGFQTNLTNYRDN
ncbi:AraC family ligand binding domain-containing protein [Sinimarinibacterium flocculans]|uniref:AraC family ligand binding domain-containing protein n=1 Tax=Sinimarinibacterium flocculans TaxID=985250 RepID=UPI0035171E5D